MAGDELNIETVRRRLFGTWMQLGTLLHKITSPIVLFILFFLIFTPYALVIRLFRRHRNFAPLPQSTYWEQRTDESQPDRNFQRQF